MTLLKTAGLNQSLEKLAANLAKTKLLSIGGSLWDTVTCREKIEKEKNYGLSVTAL